MKFAIILVVLLIAQFSCASPIEISPLPPPTTAVGNQSRTKLKHRTRPFFYGAIHTAVPNIIALNQQLPVGVKSASVREQNVPISPVERNVYTVEGDLWRVTMEPNDDEYHLEISAPVHRRAGQHEAIHRGEQASHRIRCAELHLYLPR